MKCSEEGCNGNLETIKENNVEDKLTVACSLCGKEAELRSSEYCTCLGEVEFIERDYVPIGIVTGFFLGIYKCTVCGEKKEIFLGVDTED